MPTQTKLERLREVALDQHGFVSTAQALDEGVAHAELAMMTARGRLERVAHGVYKVPQVPESRYDELHLALLWTAAAEACLSHDTALAAWDVSDINPDAIHLTVGTERRLRRRGGDRYVVHRHDLAPAEVTWWQGMRTVTAATAIAQCTAGGTPSYLLVQAIERAATTGGISRTDRVRLTAALEARDAGG